MEKEKKELKSMSKKKKEEERAWKARKENQKPHGKVKAFAELVEGTEKNVMIISSRFLYEWKS